MRWLVYFWVEKEAFELSVVTGAPLVDKRCSPWTLRRKTV